MGKEEDAIKKHTKRQVKSTWKFKIWQQIYKKSVEETEIKVEGVYYKIEWSGK